MNSSNQEHIKFSEAIIIESTVAKLSRPQNCMNSQKRIRNNSVCCNYDNRGWISLKNCDLCPHYERDPTVTQAALEEAADSVEIVNEA